MRNSHIPTIVLTLLLFLIFSWVTTMKLLSRAGNLPSVFSFTYRTAFNVMIVNLALGDIFYTTFLLAHFTLSLYLSNPYDITGNSICIVLRKLAWLGSYSAVFTMLVIARERYYTIVHPHDSKGKLTMQKLKVWDFNNCSYFMEEKMLKGSWIYANPSDPFLESSQNVSGPRSHS